MIEVKQLDDGDPMVFEVRVDEANSASQHEVKLSREDHERLAPAVEPDHLVEASFRFLLDREPKEQILSAFELPVIERYFGAYEDEIPRYL
jgi:hypothetical protein